MEGVFRGEKGRENYEESNDLETRKSKEYIAQW